MATLTDKKLAKNLQAQACAWVRVLKERKERTDALVQASIEQIEASRRLIVDVEKSADRNALRGLAGTEANMFTIEFRRGNLIIAKATTKGPTLTRVLEEVRRRAPEMRADKVVIKDIEGNEYGPHDVGDL